MSVMQFDFRFGNITMDDIHDNYFKVEQVFNILPLAFLLIGIMWLVSIYSFYFTILCVSLYAANFC